MEKEIVIEDKKNKDYKLILKVELNEEDIIGTKTVKSI